MRKDEQTKHLFRKDEQRITNYLQQKRGKPRDSDCVVVSELEKELKVKDMEIQKLTKLVKNKNTVPHSGILAGPGEVMKRPSLLAGRTSNADGSMVGSEV
jgi:hypothetical protein